MIRKKWQELANSWFYPNKFGNISFYLFFNFFYQQEALHNVGMSLEQLKITHPPLYPPGQILHVLEVEDDR